jgi:hypothetical protein
LQIITVPPRTIEIAASRRHYERKASVCWVPHIWRSFTAPDVGNNDPQPELMTPVIEKKKANS